MRPSCGYLNLVRIVSVTERKVTQVKLTWTHPCTSWNAHFEDIGQMTYLSSFQTDVELELADQDLAGCGKVP